MGVICPPWSISQHLETCLVITTEGDCYWPLVGRRQGLLNIYNAQNSFLQERIIQTKMSIVPLARMGNRTSSLGLGEEEMGEDELSFE